MCVGIGGDVRGAEADVCWRRPAGSVVGRDEDGLALGHRQGRYCGPAERQAGRASSRVTVRSRGPATMSDTTRTPAATP